LCLYKKPDELLIYMEVSKEGFTRDREDDLSIITCYDFHLLEPFPSLSLTCHLCMPCTVLLSYLVLVIRQSFACILFPFMWFILHVFQMYAPTSLALCMYVCKWSRRRGNPCTATIADLLFLPVLLICQQPCTCNEAQYLA
jgi:hypothetical protein